MPRHELVVAVTETLALGLLARSGLDDQFEDLPTFPLDRRLACGDRAAVDVHVLFHGAVERRITRKLERGCRPRSETASATRGEGDQVCAAGDLTGGRDRIVAWRIHEN